MSVTVVEPIATQVGRTIRDLGFIPGDGFGIALETTDTPHEYYLDIIDGEKRRSLFGYKRRSVIGHIVLFNRHSNYDWEFSVYGRDNMAKLVKMADNLSTTYKVNIEVVLVYEVPRVEKFPWDERY